MTTYVLVHGGLVGGWQWKHVRPLLWAAGHEVHTPTLTGLGERVHLAHPGIDLDTHITDIVMALKYEDLRDVILVGTSYSGMVITGVAEQAPERIVHLIYVDAHVPGDGECLADHLGPGARDIFIQRAEEYGDGWRVQPGRSLPTPLHTPQPLKTFIQPLRVRNPAAAAIPRTYIYCTEDKDPSRAADRHFMQAAERARSDPRWRYRELDTGHEPMVTAPRALVDLFLEVAV